MYIYVYIYIYILFLGLLWLWEQCLEGKKVNVKNPWLYMYTYFVC